MQRKTKIICTVGPATNSYPALEQLYAAGMAVVRLNMSHATQDEAANAIHWVKTLNRKVKYPVPIMLDTQGPEIRTGTLATPLRLRDGEEIYLEAQPAQAPAPGALRTIDVNYPGLPDAVAVGDRVRLDNGLVNVEVLAREGSRLRCRVADGGTLGSRKHVNLPGVAVGDRVRLDNGLVNVEVLAREGSRLRCRVADGGTLGSRKHVNLPGVAVDLPSVTAKDRDDIAFGVAQEVDFVALSFARSAEDIAEVRQLLGPKGGRTVKVLAKIENQEGVRQAEAIAIAADGVMVARGDLGIETDIALLPSVQRRLVELCARLGKRCIVATHLMESMIENPIPTRAEVTDVANAVYEGVDAIMLSGETSVGAYPVRCVRQLADIAAAAEQQRGFALQDGLAIDTDKQHLATAAGHLAEAIGAAGIVVITRRGVTADSVTNCHPKVPIYAFTNLSQTRRRLMLNRGVFAHRTAFSNDPERTIQTALKVLREREGIAEDARVIVISDVLAERTVDAIQLRSVGDAAL